MRCYQIAETLRECGPGDLKNQAFQYVVVMNRDEWLRRRDSFDMGIDIEPDGGEIVMTEAEVNYDSVTGTFALPDRSDLEKDYRTFAFALDEKGIVFIDDSGVAAEMTDQIAHTKKWRFPGLERFLFDFLCRTVAGDQRMLMGYERELDDMEDAILHDTGEDSSERLNGIRSDIRELSNHYEQLLDLTELLCDNDNDFFRHEDLRYFRSFASRIERLKDMTSALREHTIQIRDVYKTHLDVRQNNIITVLTVVTAIFMPLTLMVGWYGMNFQYMPELSSRYGYPILGAVSFVIVVAEIAFFKWKKWL